MDDPIVFKGGSPADFVTKLQGKQIVDVRLIILLF